MKKTCTFLLLFLALGVTAQTECEATLDSIKKLMNSKSIFKNYSKAFNDLLPCADAGAPLAQNYIGLLYMDGLGVEIDEAKGFKYIEQAATNKNALAQYNLGKLYKDGKACVLDMDKAVYWFKKAANAKNDRAAYMLGYMYYKGFGVSQDYQKAVAWFKKSKFDMAKHWLGVCYYLGYGVPQNTEIALEYFQSNGTPNSKAFLKNIEIGKRESIKIQTEKAITSATEGSTKIDTKIMQTNRNIIDDIAVEHKTLKSENILGDWTGLFIEYDYSGNTPLRILPIDINLSKNSQGDFQTKILFQGKDFEDVARFENNNLFVEDFKFSLSQLYNHSYDDYKLDYSVLGMDLTQKTRNKVNYLLVDVDAFIDSWGEPAPPISLVLRPKDDVSITSQDQEILLALASQKSDFIKVYPIPFKDQLYVAFELANPAQISVTLTSTSTAQTIAVATTTVSAGVQSYTVNTAELPKGYYIIRVQENDKKHTRIVIKQ